MTTPPTESSAGDYERKKRAVSEAMAALSGTEGSLRLAGRTSNLFRHRKRRRDRKLDLSAFCGVLSIDPETRVADVEARIRYDALAAATLHCGFVPPVVPQLRSITLGGAISGGGIEASSFRHGFVHERVLEMDVLLASGEVVTCRPDSEHRDLFFGIANSYGTLGYLLRARIPIVPAMPFVELRHRLFDDPVAFFAALQAACERGRTEEGGPDFVEGVAFSENELCLTTARFVDAAPRTSNYRFMQVYYRSLRERERDFLSTADFLWRWDTDWFWCSRAFGMEWKPLRFAVGSLGLLRSTTYWKIRDILVGSGALERMERQRREDVIQDVEIPISGAPAFLEFLHREVGVRPIWICPARAPDPKAEYVLYRTDPDVLYVNFGFWGRVPVVSGRESRNRRIEREVIAAGGKKSLYSISCFPEEEFWNLYNRPAYDRLKRKYDPHGRLRNLYDKCVGGRVGPEA